MPVRSFVATVATLLTLGLVAACSDGPAGEQKDSARAESPSASTGTAEITGSSRETTRVAGVTGRRVEVVAVGDIACWPGQDVTEETCRHAEVAELTERIDPAAVLGLGDMQYAEGTEWEFENSYDKSWGELKDITYPTPGNHEYRTEGAEPYFDYFEGRTPAPPGYHAFNLGRWRAYSLNSNCEFVDCAEQAAWLRQDLKERRRKCTLIATHYPRFSSGNHGDNPFMKRFFRIGSRHGVDLMLSGHDHHYERFRRMNHKGEMVRRGVMQFVSGAGGAEHYAADGDRAGSRFVDDDTFGVLRLVLRPDSFSYGFRGIDGSKQDTGSRNCV